METYSKPDIAITDSSEEDTNNDDDSVHPFNKLFNTQEYKKENNEEPLDLCSDHIRLLSLQGQCRNHTNNRKKVMRCNSLGFLNNHLYSCEKLQGTGWLMILVLWKDRISKGLTFKNPSCRFHCGKFWCCWSDFKKHIAYCLVLFIMIAKPDNAIKDDARLVTIHALTRHKLVCKSALMELMDVGSKWWATFKKRSSSSSWTERKPFQPKTKV